MTNKTQCPNCLTVYIITDEQHERSRGRVRCGTCRQAFFAEFLPSSKPAAEGRDGREGREATQKIESAELSPEPTSIERTANKTTPSETGTVTRGLGSDDEISPATTSFFEEPLSEPALAELMHNADDETTISSVSYSFGFEENLVSDLNIESEEQNDAANKIGKSQTADLIGRVDELIDSKLIAEDDSSDSGFFDETESEYGGLGEAEGALSAEGSHKPVLHDKPFTLDRRSSLRKVLTWIFAPVLAVAIILLLALLVYQLWLRQAMPILEDERLADRLEPYTSVIKKQVEEQLGWEIPVRRDLAGLRLVSARVEPHPERPSTTLLKISLSNRSNIAQPFPWLELVLTDENGRLVSRRALPPTDYLHNNRLRDVVRANELRQVTIELLAFPRQAHGYELKILNR